MNTVETLFFAIAALFVFVGGIVTVAARNPIRGAMGLLTSIVGIAGLYLMLSAEFLAAIQILVYAGAVVILFLFVIMLLGPASLSGRDTRTAIPRYLGMIVFVLASGSALLLLFKLSAGKLTSFLIYTLLVAVSLGGLSDLWADLMKASGAAERIFQLIDRAPTIPASGGEAPAKIEGKIVFSGVDFAYPTRKDAPVLRGIDLTIAPGEVVALVGSSGAGKSTLASMLMRLYDPSAGRILLDGRDLKELDPSWLRKQIGVVSHHNPSYPRTASASTGRCSGRARAWPRGRTRARRERCDASAAP